MSAPQWDKVRELDSLVARRGFVWPSGEIYGSVAGLYDYGPNGAMLKRNLEESWVRYFLGLSQDYHLVETANIVSEKALQASGHVESFADIVAECQNCKEKHRADHLLMQFIGRLPLPSSIPGEDRKHITHSRWSFCANCGEVLEPFAASIPDLARLGTYWILKCVRCGRIHRSAVDLESLNGEQASELLVELRHIEDQTKIKPICPKCRHEHFWVYRMNLMFPVHVGGRPPMKSTGAWEDVSQRVYSDLRGIAPHAVEHDLSRDQTKSPSMLLDPSSIPSFLRPETAQGAYLAFKQVFKNFRQRLPLGIAIIGRAYRNEIAPRQGVFRMREFTQAELQIFMDPETFDSRVEAEPDFAETMKTELNLVLAAQRGTGAQRMNAATLAGSGALGGIPRAYAYHLAKVQGFYLDVLKIPAARFRFAQKNEKERAFYNKEHFDVEVDMDSLGGFREVAGVHYRGDWDLSRHAIGSGESHHVEVDLGPAEQGKPANRKKLLPHVLELSFGVDRSLWALLDAHLDLRESKLDQYAYLHLPPHLAPVQVAVFPLMKKDGLAEKGKEIWTSLRKEFRAFYDESGSIGKRYARADETGTPLAVTIDYDTLKDGTVTVRDRDSTSQERIALVSLSSHLKTALARI